MGKIVGSSVDDASNQVGQRLIAQPFKADANDGR